MNAKPHEPVYHTCRGASLGSAKELRKEPPVEKQRQFSLDIIEKIDETNTKSQSGIFVDDDEDSNEFNPNHNDYQIEEAHNQKIK